MLFFRRGQRAPKVAGRITLRPTGRNCVSEDLSAVLHRPMRRFLRAPAFNPAQYGQQLRCFDFRNRSLAQPGEYVSFKPTQNTVPMAWNPSRRELDVPLARDRFETLGTGLS
jgi:hypothetical protein